MAFPPIPLTSRFLNQRHPEAVIQRRRALLLRLIDSGIISVLVLFLVVFTAAGFESKGKSHPVLGGTSNGPTINSAAGNDATGIDCPEGISTGAAARIPGKLLGD